MFIGCVGLELRNEMGLKMGGTNQKGINKHSKWGEPTKRGIPKKTDRHSNGCGSKIGTQNGLPWSTERTKAGGPIPGGSILTHTQMDSRRAEASAQPSELNIPQAPSTSTCRLTPLEETGSGGVYVFSLAQFGPGNHRRSPFGGSSKNRPNRENQKVNSSVLNK